MPNDVLGELREKSITIRLGEESLDFLPASRIDEDIRSALVEDAADLHRRGLAIRAHLASLVAAKRGDAATWQRLHSRLTNRWPDDLQLVGPYSHLVSWVAMHRLHEEAQHDLQKLSLDRTPRQQIEGGARDADRAFSERMAIWCEARLVSSCLLWPFLHEAVPHPWGP